MSIQAYQNNSVETASPGELTLMLYNGCIKFIKAAGKAMEQKDMENKNTNIQKAQRIIQELMVTMDQNTDISAQVLPLYDYMNRRLIEANTKNDAEILGEVEGLVVEFRDTWKQVILQTRKAQYAQGGNA
ncbi:flagellar export chaperone FliS [Halobacillus litoralis]|uniref:Flagellar secretion chaperone FliS n=1 Tax=Halobacillus litoralis TaxID=45668 RepID=A0A845DTZ2_9BACI|nr:MULTISPECIES: flagellar export chaperone FliS [Halobacillus]MCA1021263.1 flagellar export chaperone FliS [Halobacillus litoralis]MYL20950.1 flagellar export chaperone FliS [Halobacillus litoralis]MYL30989.1 flagellar export chaperone FliS [Halobacillus halophilus]MYL36209.1 flagellar export chaperone FliS [Halobacillus litoralis]